MTINQQSMNDLSFAYFINRINTCNYQGGKPQGRLTPLQCNQDMLDGIYPDPPGEAYVGSRSGGNINAWELAARCRELARVFSRVVRGMYGIAGNIAPAYTDYNIFYVIPGYHANHYNSVMVQIDQQPYNEMAAGNITQWGPAVYLDRLASLIINSREQETVDIRICHASCHVSCHASRGRR